MDSLVIFNRKFTSGSKVEQIEPGMWRLSIQEGQNDQYRWAQLDDYSDLPRSRFHWQAPLSMKCQARVSHTDLPGTWGFGFWNDPFNASLKIKGAGFRLPALPNTAWFFNASPENHLSLQTGRRACGFLAAVFRSPLIPSWAFLPAYILLPSLFIPSIARRMIKIAKEVILDEFLILNVNQTEWNTYRLDLFEERVDFYINNTLTSRTTAAPRGKLGALLWIDNQYAGITSNGNFQAGLLENSQPAWLEIKDWHITTLD
ncbi:MAG: hypothetical protein AB9891_22185 [Anaerolineaceae bacterium]